jgi:TRAP transporter 4TM/12TM fusion protein
MLRTSSGPSGKFAKLETATALCERAFVVLLCVIGIGYILGIHTRLGLAIYSYQYGGAFLGLALSAIFLSVPPTKKTQGDWVFFLDILLALLGLAGGFYVALFYPILVENLGAPSTLRVVLGGMTVLLILEAIRRTQGWALVLAVSFFILYARFAHLFPDPFYAKGTVWRTLINYLYLDPNGLFNMVLIGATIGTAFMFFGGVLLNFGFGQTLTDIALIIMGRFRGGPAKVAVLASSLVGTITGGAMTNVMLVGPVTIPMMKRAGYTPVEAGAIEAVASTGGQIMPPVMGIAAFVMADFLGIPYAQVALASAIPACIFYFGIFVQVDLLASKRGLKGLPPSEIPRLGHVLKKLAVLLPVGAMLVFTLFGLRLDPAVSGVASGLVALIMCVAAKETRTDFWRKLLKTLEGTGRILLDIAAILAGAGLLIGCLSISGLASSMSLSLIELAGKNLFLLLLLSAATSFILGMGMPSVAAYVLLAVLTAPALVEMGIPALAAHMFIFYWGIVSNITPPVALAAYAAAPLAGADAWRVGWTACRIAVMMYLVPFMLVFAPTLLLIGSPLKIVLDTLLSVIGVVFVMIGFVGYGFGHLRWWERGLLFVAGLVMFASITFTMHYYQTVAIFGFAIAIPVLFLNWRNKRLKAALGAAVR